MNKKIMSFVLAMVLSVGLGSAVFASDYDASSTYQAANSASYGWTEVTSSSTASDQGGTTTSQVTGQGFFITFGSAGDQLSGNLSGIFKYYAGTMIGYMQAGGNYTLFDSYGARGVLSSAGGEHFSLQSWNFRTSDLAKMEGLGNDVKAWETYLKSIGFSGEQLRRMKFDEQGNPAGTIYKYMKLKDGASPETLSEEDYNKNKDKDDGYYYYTTTEGEGDDKKTIYHRVKKTELEEGTKDDHDFAETTIGDDGVQYQSMSIGLFQLLQSTLTQGINHSATLSVGDGATGMILSVAEDGKTQATYCSYDQPANSTGTALTTTVFGTTYNNVRQMSQVLYNEDGLQYGTVSYTFEFDSTNANAKEKQVGVGGHWAASYTFINYDDATGFRYDTTFNKVAISSSSDGKTHIGDFTWAANGSTITGNIFNYQTRADAKLATSVTYYSANGSKFMSVDNEKRETTYYADNQASVVYNSSGTAIKKYQYTENGVIEAMWASDNTEDSNSDKGGTTTVFDYWGRDVATFNDTNGKMFGTHEKAKEMLGVANTYKKMLLSGADIKTGDFGSLQSINWFEEDIRPLLSTDPKNRPAAIQKIFDSKSMTTMLNFCNGVSAVATTSVAESTWDDNVPEDAVQFGETKRTTNPTKRTTNKEPGVSTYMDSSTTTVKVKAKGYTLTTTIKAGGASAFQTKCSIVTEKTETYQTTEHYVDPAVTGDILDVNAELDKMEVTDEELTEAGVDPKDKEAVKKYKMKKLAEKLGLNLPSRDDYNSDEEYEAALSTFYDNFEKGFYTDKDGKVYAILSSSKIDLMDGSGFQNTEGELILVEVTETQQAAIEEAMETGDRTVMFMGDVRESVSGQMTMAINTSYTTSNTAKDKDGNALGMVFGDEAVDAAMTEIETISTDIAGIAEKLGIDMTEFKGKSLDDIKSDPELYAKFKDVCEKAGVDPDGDSAWIVGNCLANGGVFGGNFNIQGQNRRGSLEDAWKLLVAANF